MFVQQLSVQVYMSPSSTGKLLKQVVAGGFQNKWMTNAFKTSGWPMLLILAEANAFKPSGAYNGGGLRPPLPKWGRRPSAAGPIWGIHSMLR